MKKGRSPLSGQIRFTKTELQSKYGELKANRERTLMDQLLEAGLPVASSCRGDGVCAKCRLHVRDLSPNATSPIEELERRLLIKTKAESDERIACQTYVYGPIEVDADYW